MPQPSSLQHTRPLCGGSQGSSQADQLCTRPTSIDQVQKPPSEPVVGKPNADTLLKLRIPKLRKYVLAMLKEKYSFQAKTLDLILTQQGEEKITSLQNFGEMLYQCLLEYQEEYAGIYD